MPFARLAGAASGDLWPGWARDLAGHALARGTRPAPLVVAVIGAIVAVLVLWRPSWRVTRYAATACHEAGDALVARLTGRRLSGVRLERDSGGLTVSRGRPCGPGLVATLLAGYLAPSAAGLAAAVAVREGWPGLVLLGALGATAGLAVWVRNAFGWLVVLVLAGAVAAGLGEPRVIGHLALGIAVFLLLAGVRDAIGLRSARRRTRATDADHLARITWLPAQAWVVLFGLLTLAAAGGGGWLLLA